MTRLITIFDKNLNQRVFRLFDENEIVHKIDTNLTISASSTSIDVGNNVELTGVLTDENSVPLGGMSIRILKNNVLVDTVTTNSSGVYSKIITGLDIGTYHFHASYAGNDVYDNALSETVDVSVVGHTYAVTITADKQSMLITESVTITGTVTRDGTGYAGQSVRIFDSGVLVDTVTTGANGDYTKTVSNLTQGTHRFSSQFDVYESSIVVVEVVEHNYSIGIVADNPIIQSGDTSIITATLLDGTDPVINESLSYTLSNKGTVVGSGSALTNSNGQISINYVGAGLGDIDVEVSYGTLLQETYELIDYMFYDDATTDNLSAYDINNQIQIQGSTRGTMTYDSSNQRYNIDTKNDSTILIPITSISPTNNLVIEADIYLSANDWGSNLGVGFYNQSTNSNIQFVGISNTNLPANIYENADHLFGNKTIRNKWVLLKVEVQGQNIVMSMFDKSDNSLIATYNYTMSLAVTSNTKVGLVRYNGYNPYNGYIRNIKVKAL